MKNSALKIGTILTFNSNCSLNGVRYQVLDTDQHTVTLKGLSGQEQLINTPILGEAFRVILSDFNEALSANIFSITL